METIIKSNSGYGENYGVRSLMRDSWALPATRLVVPARERALELAGDQYEPYPDDTLRGLDHASPTGTKGAYDPYTGVFGTAGTPITCGYGMSGSTIGIGYTAGRRLWEEGTHRDATPGTYAYRHGGNPRPVLPDTRKAATSERGQQAELPAKSAPARRGGILAWLFDSSVVTA